MKRKETAKQFLSAVFLSRRARVNLKRPSLAYSFSIGVRVPDYEVERKMWINEHYEGGYLFRNSLIVELTPPQSDAAKWKVKCKWQIAGSSENGIDADIDVTDLDTTGVEINVPFGGRSSPGIQGSLRFAVSAWN